MMVLGMVNDLIHIDAVAVARHSDGAPDEPGDETVYGGGLVTDDRIPIVTDDGTQLHTQAP